MSNQFRGHCQCCGREQAVRSGHRMSLHGYKVENGWFNGVCNGENFAPIEKDITQSNVIINQIKADIAILEKQVESIEKAKCFHLQ